jgi:hypothetical protein
MQNGKIIIHARFNASGRVTDIDECPPWADVQQWFDILSYSTVNCYQALSNGRGLFRIDMLELASLKIRH